MSNGINVNLGSGAFASTMLGGGIALLVTSGLIANTSPEWSGKLFASGWLIIILSWILYLARWSYKHWLLTYKD